MILDGWLREDKFLHFFELKTYADSCCCFSLKTGVRILSFLSFLLSFLGIFAAPSILSFFITGLTLLASGFLIYSTFHDDFKSAFSGYFILMVLFYLDILKNLIVIIIVLIINPTAILVLLLFVLAIAIIYAIQIYFLWLFYSFAISLKGKQSSTNNNTNTDTVPLATS